jgi:RNA polymerase sigma-70 factor, ECF subfamily
MSEADVEQAVLRVKAGAVDDYRTVVVEYHQRLRASLVGFCPPGVDADEVAHLSFIEAYRNIQRYRERTSFFSWLSAIARHRLLAECERIQRQARNQQNYLEHALAQRLHLGATEEQALDDTRLKLLTECVSLLKPDAQSLLENRYGRRLSVASMADALGRTAAAVSAQLFAVRQKLRECVEKKWRAFIAART